jgi:hypothetical protein
MFRGKNIYMVIILLTGVMVFWGSCAHQEVTRVEVIENPSENDIPAVTQETEKLSPPNVDLDMVPIPDKMALWTDETQLRGANIFQRKVYPELDGPEFMGAGYVGPPYTQEDLNRLADFGANLVVISHPGLFSVYPPYNLDVEIQSNLDDLLLMIAEADMFAVIAYRTGPGRSAFTFHLDEVGDWFDKSYLDDSVWEKEAAQEAWVIMWQHTAERYRSNPAVAGYHLMVEPNADEVFFQIYEPDEFYDKYANSSYDWNRLYPRILAGIRKVDKETPVLVGGMGYSSLEWLPYLIPTDDTRTVYVVHQYAPVRYTHQTARLKITYPGVYNLDWDRDKDNFNGEWIDALFIEIDEFIEKYHVPVAIAEFGLMRWEPGAARFMNDQMALLEDRKLNHALWVWDPSYRPWTEEVDAFNFRHGPEKRNHKDVDRSDLITVIRKYWGRNTIRPSSFIK